MRFLTCLLAFLLPMGALTAQMTTEQRVQDFQNLAALYAKRYAPYEWKKLAYSFDLMNLKPWLERVRAAKDDLEFYEIQAEYVASLKDTHSRVEMPSTFSASLGMTVDIYDGKVLIDGIARSRLPAEKYPFEVGDEVVSVDGKTAEEWIALLSKWRSYGNTTSTRRAAAGQIVARSQALYPRAVEIGADAEVTIRRAGGDVERYSIPWVTSGVAIRNVGPVPNPASAARPARAAEPAERANPLAWLQNWQLPDSDPLWQRFDWAAGPDGEPRGYILSQGSRTPVFSGGLPTDFVKRSGTYLFSGTYKSGDLTIGYIRIPGFSPTYRSIAIAELDQEIVYMQKSTDGLVVDVMRNNGGGCYMLDVAARLIPYTFYFFGQLMRPTQDVLNSYQSKLATVKAGKYPAWVVTSYEGFVEQISEALRANRGMTEPIAACTQYYSDWAPVREGNPPADNVYTKPMAVLVDEFSISAADIFPAMIQDNGRALLVGKRTSGGGGSVNAFDTGFYSESAATVTESLVVRKNPVVSPGLPTAPYVENIGAIPDIELDYMTRENLLNGGKTFVDKFTAILVEQIGKTKQ